MKEPTRQQIKEAFQKTIERWERIVEDVDYFDESECDLCLLEGTKEDYVCSQLCPVRLYGKKGYCNGTPYKDFFRSRTPENALAELNFLRKVYIWWMEGELNKIFDKWGASVVRARKEWKKEEWVDVTDEIEWIAEDYPKQALPHMLYGTHENGDRMGYISSEGFGVCFGYEDKYRIEQSGQTFRYIKKT